MAADTLARAAEFIWINARLLDRRRFAYHFTGGTREAVLTALAAYANPDGGFGNALEPDLRCPDSQPVPAEVALRVLDEVGMDLPVARRLCDYLQTITTDEGGVPFVLPTARAYPAAPWWLGADDPPRASVNPTAAVAGLLHKHGVEHPWLERADAYVWSALDAGHSEMHDVAAIVTFLEYAPDRARAERRFAVVGERILNGGLVALDPAETDYVKKPLDWAPTPDSLCRSLFSVAVIAAHLDALAANQQADGGWPIAWPPVGPGGELEWRGAVTVDALKTLRAYGRLPA